MAKGWTHIVKKWDEKRWQRPIQKAYTFLATSFSVTGPLKLSDLGFTEHS